MSLGSKSESVASNCPINVDTCWFSEILIVGDSWKWGFYSINVEDSIHNYAKLTLKMGALSLTSVMSSINSCWEAKDGCPLSLASIMNCNEHACMHFVDGHRCITHSVPWSCFPIQWLFYCERTRISIQPKWCVYATHVYKLVLNQCIVPTVTIICFSCKNCDSKPNILNKQNITSHPNLDWIGISYIKWNLSIIQKICPK